MKALLNLCRYSGGIVLFKLNPFQWNIRPRFQAVSHFGDDRVYSACWLFFEIRIWLDSGNW